MFFFLVPPYSVPIAVPVPSISGDTIAVPVPSISGDTIAVLQCLFFENGILRSKLSPLDDVPIAVPVPSIPGDTIAVLQCLFSENGVLRFKLSTLFRKSQKQFYETYCDNEKLATLVREIGWSNNLTIMTQAKSDEKKEFYLRLCIDERLKYKELKRQIAACVYERSVLNKPKLATVLREIAPKAQEVFRDTYVMEFITGQEAKPENSLRKTMLKKMKQLILELGKDFIAMEEEFRVQVGTHDYRIDLLFYHRRLQCLVAFELKTEEFQPEHLGQLNFYLEALDRDVRYENENPSIGVLLCKSKDDEVVEYALSRTLSPTLVAQYELMLPDKELLQKRVREVYEQSLELIEHVEEDK